MDEDRSSIFSKKNFFNFILVLLLLLAIPLVVFLLQKTQIFKSRASSDVISFVGPSITPPASGGNGFGTVTSSTVQINLFAPGAGTPTQTGSPTPTATQSSSSTSAAGLKFTPGSSASGNLGDAITIGYLSSTGATKWQFSGSTTFSPGINIYVQQGGQNVTSGSITTTDSLNVVITVDTTVGAGTYTITPVILNPDTGQQLSFTYTITVSQF